MCIWSYCLGAAKKIANILLGIKQPVTTPPRAVNWLKKNDPAALRLLEDRQPDGKVWHRFWQRGGGYDRNLWSIEEVREKIEYTHANPVRRGLVSHSARLALVKLAGVAGRR